MKERKVNKTALLLSMLALLLALVGEVLRGISNPASIGISGVASALAIIALLVSLGTIFARKG